MPFVRVTLAANTLPPDTSAALVTAIHEAVVAVEGDALRTGIGVLIDDRAPGILNCAAFAELTVIRLGRGRNPCRQTIDVGRNVPKRILMVASNPAIQPSTKTATGLCGQNSSTPVGVQQRGIRD